MCMTVLGQAQGIPYRIQFVDKGPVAFVPGSPLYDSVLRTFSPRALARRAMIGTTPLLDSLDAPIYAPYVDAVRNASDRIVLSLPWFNTIVVECGPDDSSSIAQLPCVSSITPVSRRAYVANAELDCSPPEYGDEDLPHEVLQTSALHNGGVYGSDVLIGVIDTGFRWREMSSLSNHLDVLGEIDLIQGDTNTANDSLDPSSQERHGSSVLSVLAGWEQDSLIGIAPFASFLLAKTEDMRYEHRIEEEAYASVVMILERRGVDIVSSSLGYRIFDEGQDSTRYDDLDGSTTWAARAINIAAMRGVFCVTSAGNDGPSGRTIITPADADSVVTIGALAQDGVSPWTKSSWGPTADGRQKPEFSAPGVGIRCQESDNTYSRPSGTSIAAPIFAGGVALLRQLYPTLPPWTLREALRQSSQRGALPDTVAGFGAPDVTRAAQLLGPGIGLPVISTIDSKRSVFVCIYTNRTVSAQMIVRDPITGTTSTSTGLRIESPWYVFPLEAQQLFRDRMDARIIVTPTSGGSPVSYPRDTSWFALPANQLIVPCGVRMPGSVTSVDVAQTTTLFQIADNPVDAGTKCIDIVGSIDEFASALIVHTVTGVVEHTNHERHGADRVQLCVAQPLARGGYLIVLRDSLQTRTLPLVVR